MADFDFEYWSALASRDPEAFFRARQALIEEFISSHRGTQATRLRDMQDLIDAARLSAGTPMNALRSLCGLMDERLGALSRQAQALREASRRLDACVTELAGL